MDLIIGKTLTKKILISTSKVKEFARLSGDINPIHTDPEFASHSIFKRPIAHGMLIGSFISAILANELPGPGTIYLQQNLSFKKPVYLDQEVAITVTVKTRLKHDIYEISTTCSDLKGMLLVDGLAVVKI